MYTVEKIANILNAKILGDKTKNVENILPFDEAKELDITFVADKKFLSKINLTKAEVIIISEEDVKKVKSEKTFILIEKNVRNILPQLIKFFKKEVKSFDERIEKDSKINGDVKIAPNSYIGHNVEIGKGSIIYPNVTILEGVKIGENAIIYPNVTIREFCEIGNDVILQSGAVIGSDGFGYATVNGKHIKIEQIGKVIIEDNVEIGANTSIDRGTIGNTIIKKGTKIDNLVHIGHNDKIGENCLIIAQVGMAGSVEIGNNVILAGQVGVAGHLKIGDNVVVAAKSGVTKEVKSNLRVSGFPVQDHKKDLKTKIAMTKLLDLRKKVKKIEKKLEELK